MTCWPTGKRKNAAFVSNTCMLLHSRPGYRQEIPLLPLWFSQGRQHRLIPKTTMLRIHLSTAEEGGGGGGPTVSCVQRWDGPWVFGDSLPAERTGLEQ